MKTGRIAIRATVLTPIHHSRGTVGNISMVRTEELADGARVPFIAGNSFKGRLRRAGVQFALDAMGVGNELTKAQVDLLFSGGHLSKGGQAIDLARAREIERRLPFLSLLGYAAGNTMTESKVRCEHWHLVCEENRFRLPEGVEPTRRAGQLLTTEFGTRRDVGTSQVATKFLTGAEQKRLSDHKSGALDKTHPDKKDSAQMIYDFQCLRAGSELFSGIAFWGLSDMEWSALLAALWAMTAEIRGDAYVWHLGGKNGVGYGQVLVRLDGAIIPDVRPTREETVALESTERPVDSYVAFLRDNRDEILGCVKASA